MLVVRWQLSWLWQSSITVTPEMKGMQSSLPNIPCSGLIRQEGKVPCLRASVVLTR